VAEALAGVAGVAVNGPETHSTNKAGHQDLVVGALAQPMQEQAQTIVIFQTVAGNLIQLWSPSDPIRALEELQGVVLVVLEKRDIFKIFRGLLNMVLVVALLPIHL
jgi:hypothetical protein